jgi:hypothetical protein
MHYFHIYDLITIDTMLLMQFPMIIVTAADKAKIFVITDHLFAKLEVDIKARKYFC